MAKVFRLRSVIRQRVLTHDQLLFNIISSKGLQNYSEAIPFDHSLQHLENLFST